MMKTGAPVFVAPVSDRRVRAPRAEEAPNRFRRYGRERALPDKPPAPRVRKIGDAPQTRHPAEEAGQTHLPSPQNGALHL